MSATVPAELAPDAPPNPVGQVAPQTLPAGGRFSPITRRRWANFRANRRGYWSFWIFLVLFGLSLFAEFIANDKPILASYKGELLFPIVKSYPEEKFGGFLAYTNFRDQTIQKEIAEHGWAIWPPSMGTAPAKRPRDGPAW